MTRSRPWLCAPAARAGLAVAVALAAAGSLQSSQEASSESSLTPGTVALLVESLPDASSVDALRAALEDPQPEVRAAAARVVHGAGVAVLLPEVWTALEREKIGFAAAEMARAAIVVGSELDAATLEAVIGSGEEPARAVADALGRTRGRGAMPLLAPLVRAGALGGFLRASAWDAGAVHVVVPALFQHGDADDWRTFLSLGRDGDPPLEVAHGVVRAGLGHEDPAWRVESLWHVAVELGRGNALPESTRDALKPAPATTAGEPARDEESFLRAVARRLLGASTAEEGWSDWLAEGAARPLIVRLARERDLHGALTRDELGVIGRRYDGEPLAQTDDRAASGEQGADAGEQPGRPSALDARTLSGYPPGFVEGVLDASGCRPEPREPAETPGAVVTFFPNGRPRSIQVFRGFDESRACHAAVAILLLTAVAPIGHGVSGREMLLMPLEPGFVECLAARPEPPAHDAPARVGGEITEPRKVRNVTPHYPEGARQDRVQGLVILESTITPTGCIGDLRLVRSPDDRLTAAAIAAVAGWRYTPTLVDGDPVPVMMTVTVNFRFD